jgi:dTDP-4-dehydrorhamnose reductase
MKIVMTGGSGLLGTEMKKIDSSIIAPSHADFDITSLESIERGLDLHKPDVVMHLAAATKPPEHEKSPEPGLTVNIIGTANLALACHRRGIRLVYTSTDYIYVGKGPHREDDPILAPYKFAWSKLGGEAAVALLPKGLIIRLSFGPVPFPWEKVYDNQTNSKLYVDEMAPLVLALTKSDLTGIVNVGGPRATLAQYAARTRPDITTIPTPDWVPKDTSLNIDKMKKTLGIDDEQTILKH